MTRQPLPARQNRLLRHYLAEAVSHARSPYNREPMKNITVVYRHNFSMPCPTIPRSVLKLPAMHTSFGANTE
jgi:hypothetical protein